jgi:TonB family protein
MAHRLCKTSFLILYILLFTGFAGSQNTGVGSGTNPNINSGEPPYVAGSGVTNPVVLAQPRPPYTEEARNAHIIGNIAVQCIVRKDGTIDSFKMLRGLGYGLDESVIHTVATQWRFKPGTKNGVPVDVLINIEVAFSLDGKRPQYGPTDWISPQPVAADEMVLFANFEPNQTPSLSYGLHLGHKISGSTPKHMVGMLIEQKNSGTLKRVEIVVRKYSGGDRLTGFLMRDNNGPGEVIEEFYFEVPSTAALKPTTIVAQSSQHLMLKAKERYWFVMIAPEDPNRYIWYQLTGQALTSIVLFADVSGSHPIQNKAPGAMLRLIGDAPPHN